MLDAKFVHTEASDRDLERHVNPADPTGPLLKHRPDLSKRQQASDSAPSKKQSKSNKSRSRKERSKRS